MSILRFFQPKTTKSFVFYDAKLFTITHKKSPTPRTAQGHIGQYNNEIQNHYNSFNFQLSTKPSEKNCYVNVAEPAYAKKHKLIRNYRSFLGGKHRPLHGGFFTPVSCAPSVLSGVHRIQQAQAEYMHRFLEATITPANFVPIIEKLGATPMLTALKGELRPNTEPQLRLPSIPVPADSDFTFPESDLDYITTPNGVLVTYTGLMVAWVYKGHAGSRTNPNRCTFYDVAFPSLTTGEQNRITGVMLDSASFESLADAVQFVESTFSGGAQC